MLGDALQSLPDDDREAVSSWITKQGVLAWDEIEAWQREMKAADAEW